MAADLLGNRSMNQSNPKKATKRAIVWWLLIISALLFPLATNAQHQQSVRRFVSLTLCSDRLLMAIARPEQIAALSTFSTDAYSMLDKVNTDKPVVDAELTDLLPFADATILLNQRFYPRLSNRLRTLDFRTMHINDNPQDAGALFDMVRQLGQLTDNPDRAEALIGEMKAISHTLSERFAQQIPRATMVLADSGVMDTLLPQYQQLFSLLNLHAARHNMGLNFSPEQLILAHPDVLIILSATPDYTLGGQWFRHPVIRSWARDKSLWHEQSRYFYCFDHGIWRGALQLASQLP